MSLRSLVASQLRSPSTEAVYDFIGSYAPHARVAVVGSWDASLLAAYIRTRSGAVQVTQGLDPEASVIVVARPIGTRKLRELAQREATIVLTGPAVRYADSLQRAVERYVLDGTRVRVARPDEAATVVVAAPATRLRKLHLASGPQTLPGWINIDNKPYPGVNRLLDLRNGLPFEEVDYIFAEHFVEHLEYADSLALFRECRRVLAPNGVLRLSTPNLDWVWAVSYHPGQWPDDAFAIRECLMLNRAFHGWGHRVLYNKQTLAELLRQSGFAEIDFRAYGQSPDPELQNLERHEQYPDSPELPHVLVVEARGRAENPVHPEIAATIAEYQRDIAIT